MSSLSIIFLYIKVLKDPKKLVEDAITFNVKKRDTLNFENMENLLCTKWGSP